MYARNVRIKLRADSTQEFGRLLDQKIIPLLHRQKGFRSEISLVSSKRNEAIVISFWEDQESADAYNHVGYLDVLRLLSEVVDSMPVVETFDVVDAQLHARAARAAGSEPAPGVECC